MQRLSAHAESSPRFSITPVGSGPPRNRKKNAFHQWLQEGHGFLPFLPSPPLTPIAHTAFSFFRRKPEL